MATIYRLKLFRVFSKALSTAEEVEGALLFSACFLKNRAKTGTEHFYFHLVFKTLNSFIKK